MSKTPQAPYMPRLILAGAPHDERDPMLYSTWEQRQGYRDRDGALLRDPTLGDSYGPMPVADLIRLMGKRHMHHPEYVPRPGGLLPLPDLTGVNGPVIGSRVYERELDLRQLLWRLRK